MERQAVGGGAVCDRYVPPYEVGIGIGIGIGMWEKRPFGNGIEIEIEIGFCFLLLPVWHRDVYISSRAEGMGFSIDLDFD